MHVLLTLFNGFLLWVYENINPSSCILSAAQGRTELWHSDWVIHSGFQNTAGTGDTHLYFCRLSSCQSVHWVHFWSILTSELWDIKLRHGWHFATCKLGIIFLWSLEQHMQNMQSKLSTNTSQPADREQVTVLYCLVVKHNISTAQSLMFLNAWMIYENQFLKANNGK